MRSQPTAAELIGACILTGILWMSAFAAWRAGAYLGLVVMVLLALLGSWGIIDMLRQGLRPPTAFERFETRLFMRFIAIVTSGGALVALLYWAGYGAGAALVLVLVLLGGLLSLSRLRGKSETSAGYKRRVGYRDPEQPGKHTGEG